jgi:sugar/nucleoside kinase (ribokinase family)
MARPRLAVVGYASIDEILGAGSGAEPVSTIGGGAVYAALSALRLGVDVSLHVCFGHDFPKTWIAELERLGVDLSASQWRDHPTRRTRLSYLVGEQRSAEADRSAAWIAATEALQPPMPSNRFDGLLLCPMPLPLVARAIAKARGAPIVADTSEVFAAEGPSALEAFAGVDLFAPSLAEVHRLSGERDETRAMARLAAAMPSLVVKKGRRGLSRFEAGGELHHAIEAIDAVDPTGAGDAAVGALAAGLLLGWQPLAQLEAAAAAGRRAVSATGPAAFGWMA